MSYEPSVTRKQTSNKFENNNKLLTNKKGEYNLDKSSKSPSLNFKYNFESKYLIPKVSLNNSFSKINMSSSNSKYIEFINRPILNMGFINRRRLKR